jgi:dienelactone hydrolase
MNAATTHPPVSLGGIDLDALSRARTWTMIGYGAVGLGLVTLATQLDYGLAGRLTALVAALVAALILGALALRGPVASGVAALVAGTLGIAVGGGYAVAHLVIEGVSGAALLALPALPAGVALLVLGTIGLVRATPGWWRLLAIPVGFVLLQFVLLPLVVAVGGATQPRTGLSGAIPDGAEAVPLLTEDGVPLMAWYTPSTNGAAVVLLPGSGGDKGSTLAHAAVLARNGYGVLALDARGQGDSGGVANAWGWRGDLDIAAALSYLQNRPDVDPGRVAAVGLSMGAEQAIGAAGLDPRLRAVVAEGASARTSGDVTWLGGELTDHVQRVLNPILWGVVDVLTEASQPTLLREALARTSAPVLLIVGNDAAEAGAAPGLVAAAPDRVELWELPDTPHISGLAVHPAEWEARVSAFLAANLAP